MILEFGLVLRDLRNEGLDIVRDKIGGGVGVAGAGAGAGLGLSEVVAETAGVAVLDEAAAAAAESIPYRFSGPRSWGADVSSGGVG